MLIHSFINLAKECLLSKLYDHIYYIDKISGTDDLKSETKSVMLLQK